MQMILYSKISELKHNNVDVLKPPNLNVIFFFLFHNGWVRIWPQSRISVETGTWNQWLKIITELFRGISMHEH